MSAGLTIVTEPLGGGSLARLAASAGGAPQWFAEVPGDAGRWETRLRTIARSAPEDWFPRLSAAFGATGAARERLEGVARAGGVVVTTGQQPGLFGGPIYTWSKAVSAVALADELQLATGIPTAPIFWAATDDADYREAASTWIATAEGATLLEMPPRADEAVPMAETPLGDVRALLEKLSDATGSAIDASILDVARLSYHPGATVGGAYLTLLRVLLEPLGIAVLDASHPALLDAERPHLVRALECGGAIASALATRSAELQSAGHVPQVADVDGLSLVFSRAGRAKARVPLADADAIAARAATERLSPNVLLRPVVERAVLPTVAYVAGPGELSYFAQVGAVATAMKAEVPLAVPRWSCTIVERHVERMLDRLGVTPDELATSHAVEGRLAKMSIPVEVAAAVASLRASLASATTALCQTLEDRPGLLDARVVEGIGRQMSWRVDHLERRLVRGAKRREHALMRSIAACRGALYPGGKRQERALNFLPLLARHGPALLTAMREAARAHAQGIVHRSITRVPSA